VNWDEMAVVGRVARPHGLRGQVVVNVETDFPEDRFRPGAEVFVRQAAGGRPVTITSVRFHRERPIVGLEGVETVESASALAGAELRVPVDRLSPLPAGSYYRHDLVGCRVERAIGDAVGVVVEVEGDAGNCRLVVKGPGGVILVPLAASICRRIDPAAKRIVIDPPEGLLDLNAQP
jgi:16S rRNA processing protein RimM